MPPFAFVVAHTGAVHGVAQQHAVGVLFRGDSGESRGGAGIEEIESGAHVKLLPGRVTIAER